MPPKRKAADSESGPAKKKAATVSTGPKLKKSKAPHWSEVSEFSFEKPTGEWAKKSVERWCLLPPYDTSISEKQWESYYNERAALDKVNSSGAAESKDVVCEYLYQDTWEILRKASADLAGIVLGTKLENEERKKQIARTLMGSLYYLQLNGSDEGDDTPRDVQAKSRLYSPFGVGSSIDFNYRYNYRLRTIRAGRDANSRSVSEINPENPTKCSAIELYGNSGGNAAYDTVMLFDRKGSKSEGTTAANIKSFEETLFATEGWISPLKLVEILFAAGTVMCYREVDEETPKSVLKKFNYFARETNAQALVTQELKALAELEAKDSKALKSRKLCDS